MSGAVRRWLQEQGFERFAELFEANEIDDVSLRELGDGHLKELGIPLGPRIRLLRAIEALRDAEEVAASSAVAAPSPAGQAERRQLTVMFVDLVGSTALSARLDPEEMGAVLRAYQNAVAGEIARFEGHVAKFMGDGVLAYFGWPRAHEDEAERAVRAGLAVRDAVGRLTGDGSPLACRVGIATGLVVVGELIGEGTASEQTVVGDTPNLAARLQALARPGQVVVAAATRRLLGADFQLDGLGERGLKGLAAPVRVWAVVGERAVASRFEAKGRFQPMVGRDQELAQLLEHWAQARAGHGRAVLLVGEAGVGKSRVGRALLDAVASMPHTRIRYQCSPYHQDSALWPVVQQLRHAAGLVATDAAAVRLGKLEKLLGQAGEVADAVAPIADLLGIEGAARHGALAPTPQARRERLLAALADQLRGLAQTQPVLMLLEDVHWIDPTTLELVDQCLDLIAGWPVLMLLTSRPDEQPALAARPHVTRLELNRLARASATAIVARLAGNRLPPATVDAIIARTDGVPLYVEELTRAVLEAGEPGDVAIPASLHDSLMARLDRAPEAKEVAQIAACIGREFGHSLLAAVTGRDEVALAAALDSLVAAELVFRRGTSPNARYVFKHALVRDAAYESLLLRRRTEIHAQLAELLEAQKRQGIAVAPEVLARHLEAGGEFERALDYWKTAGDEARARYANREAIVSYGRALGLLARLPQSTNRDRVERELRLAASRPILAGEGYTSREFGQNAARLVELARAAGSDATLWPALYDVGRMYHQRADLAGAEACSLETIAIGERTGDRRALVAGLYPLGINMLLRGDLVTARLHLDRGVALDVSAQEQTEDSDSFQAGLGCSFGSAHLYWHLGYPVQARAMAGTALGQAETMDRPFSLAFALQRTSILCQLEHTEQPAQENVDRFLALHAEYPAAHWLPWILIIRAWGHAAEDRLDAALADLEQAWPLWHARGGSEFLGPYFRCVAAEIYLAAGQHDRARQLLDEAFALQEATGQRHWAAELHRNRAALALAVGSTEGEVEEELNAALTITREQSARSLELRAARDLARLWVDRGERQRALDLLAPVYDWFTEGFDTPDLVEAKALLDAL